MIIINTLIIMNAIDMLPKEIWFHILNYIDDYTTYNQLPFVCQLFNQYYIISNKIKIRKHLNAFYISNNNSIIGKLQTYIKINLDDYPIHFYFKEHKQQLVENYSIYLKDDFTYLLWINHVEIRFSNINDLFDYIKTYRLLLVNHNEKIFNVFKQFILQYVDLYLTDKFYLL